MNIQFSFYGVLPASFNISYVSIVLFVSDIYAISKSTSVLVAKL